MLYLLYLQHDWFETCTHCLAGIVTFASQSHFPIVLSLAVNADNYFKPRNVTQCPETNSFLSCCNTTDLTAMFDFDAQKNEKAVGKEL